MFTKYILFRLAYPTASSKAPPPSSNNNTFKLPNQSKPTKEGTNDDATKNKSSRHKKKKSKSKDEPKDQILTNKPNKEVKHDDLALWLSSSNGYEENNTVTTVMNPPENSEKKKTKKEKRKNKEKKETSAKLESEDLLDIGANQGENEPAHQHSAILGNWELAAEDRSLQMV